MILTEATACMIAKSENHIFNLHHVIFTQHVAECRVKLTSLVALLLCPGVTYM